VERTPSRRGWSPREAKQRVRRRPLFSPRGVGGGPARCITFDTTAGEKTENNKGRLTRKLGPVPIG
jgi:hypothetical protein